MAETKSIPMSAGKELQARIRAICESHCFSPRANNPHMTQADGIALCANRQITKAANEAALAALESAQQILDGELEKALKWETCNKESSAAWYVRVTIERIIAAIQRLAEEVKHAVV